MGKARRLTGVKILGLLALAISCTSSHPAIAKERFQSVRNADYAPCKQLHKLLESSQNTDFTIQDWEIPFLDISVQVDDDNFAFTRPDWVSVPKSDLVDHIQDKRHLAQIQATSASPHIQKTVIDFDNEWKAGGSMRETILRYDYGTFSSATCLVAPEEYFADPHMLRFNYSGYREPCDLFTYGSKNGGRRKTYLLTVVKDNRIEWEEKPRLLLISPAAYLVDIHEEELERFLVLRLFRVCEFTENAR